MNTRTKIYIALGAAALVFTAILVGSAVSDLRLRRLEREIEVQKQRADSIAAAAAEKEAAAQRYAEKEDDLERRLAEIEAEKRRQDENLEKLDTTVRDARGRVTRARQGPAATDIDGLCKQLADVGHECGPR